MEPHNGDLPTAPLRAPESPQVGRVRAVIETLKMNAAGLTIDSATAAGTFTAATIATGDARIGGLFAAFSTLVRPIVDSLRDDGARERAIQGDHSYEPTDSHPMDWLTRTIAAWRDGRVHPPVSATVTPDGMDRQQYYHPKR